MGHIFGIAHGFWSEAHWGRVENFQDLHQYDNEILQVADMHPIKAHVTNEVAREGEGSIMAEITQVFTRCPLWNSFVFSTVKQWPTVPRACASQILSRSTMFLLV